MKKILISLCALMALVGCMDNSFTAPDTVIPESECEIVSPLRVSIGEAVTKSFDENLKWSWRESDEVLGYQVSGTKYVNALTHKGGNVFECPDFMYATQDPATFHFIYAGDAVVDNATKGFRGIRQSERQSGKWTPVLVGSVINKTLSETINDEAIIDVEHLSAALEVRVWNTGVNKESLSDADKKIIKYAKLYSDSECFLLDLVPVFNGDGTVAYNERERGGGEPVGACVRTDDVNSSVVVFNIAPNESGYDEGDLKLAIIDREDNKYILDVPRLNFFAGKRTILNVEWKTPSSAYLPEGETFNSKVKNYISRVGSITKIKFITNSPTTSSDELVSGSVYLVKNNEVLEIHTPSDRFVANKLSNNMFYGYQNKFSEVTEIDFGDNFDTSSATTMESMFALCDALKKLDLSDFNTQNVTNMYYMFANCGALTEINLSSFDTRKVEDMRSMFKFCQSLTAINLSSFNTSKVTDMRSMFHWCNSLESLDLSNFDVSKVKYMDNMFYQCTSLEELDIRHFNIAGNPSISSIFEGMHAHIYVTDLLRSFILTKLGNCTNLIIVDKVDPVNEKIAYLPPGPKFNKIVNDFLSQNSGITKINFITNSNIKSADILVDDKVYLVQNGSILEIHAKADEYMANYSCRDMFYGKNLPLDAITTINLGENFNTSRVTSMSDMFKGCSRLTNLDLKCFNTGNVVDIDGMFYGCSSLQAVDLSRFNTQNATSFSYMFYGCSSLTSLNLSNFVTSKVNSMSGMFENCTGLEALDLSNFNFTSCTSNYSVSSMFNNTGSIVYSRTGNKIPIYVTQAGYDFLQPKNGYTGMYSAVLTVK